MSAAHSVHANKTARAQRAGKRFQMEAVEPRCLRSVFSWSSSFISNPSGDYFAGVLFGDNGDEWGWATGTAGVGGDEHCWVYHTWDDDVSNGLDSGWVPMRFAINADGEGSGSLSVGYYTDSFYAGTASVEMVTIRAVVTGADMQFDWMGLQVHFYRDGQIAEVITHSGFGVSTMGAQNNDPAEAGIIVTPEGENFDGVVVHGYARLRAAEGVYPGATDIFGQVFVS